MTSHVSIAARIIEVFKETAMLKGPLVIATINKVIVLVAMFTIFFGCEGPTSKILADPELYEYNYVIGPGDNLEIFVWQNPEISRSVVVRPDGKISAPLVKDMVASGKTSTQLADDIAAVLSQYIRDPLVTIIVENFKGVFGEQIRVVGQATTPQSLPYRAEMTLLDVIIAVGGLTEFAAGNRAKIVRSVNGEQRELNVRIEDLIQDGDISANVRMAPGDIVIIPEAWF